MRPFYHCLAAAVVVSLFLPAAASSSWEGVRPKPVEPPYYYPYPPPYQYHPYYPPERPWYEKEMPIPAGRVMLLVEPMQAEVFVNGYPLKRHPDLSYEVSLLEGEHQIEITAEGYGIYRRSIEIRGNERIRLTIRLEQKTD